MSHGIQVRSAQGDVTFDLTTRLTTLVLSRVVGANSSGSVWLDIPLGAEFAAQAIPLDGDQYMSHVPHKLTYNANNRVLSWAPAVVSESEVANLAYFARPRRSRSRILVFSYMPQSS